MISSASDVIVQKMKIRYMDHPYTPIHTNSNTTSIFTSSSRIYPFKCSPEIVYGFSSTDDLIQILVQLSAFNEKLKTVIA